MSKTICPLCDKRCSFTSSEYYFDHSITKGCNYCHALIMENEILVESHSSSECILNMIFSDLISRNDPNLNLRYYLSDEDSEPLKKDDFLHINVKTLMKNYPTTMLERFDKILLNMYNVWTMDHLENFAYDISCNFLIYKRIFMCDQSKTDYIENAVKTMAVAGYIQYENDWGCFFTEKGWNRLYELIGNNFKSQDVFIAMAFKGTEDIRIAIKQAVESVGYIPILIDEVEHNNQIVPEIMAHIRRSCFLIMDLTVPNFGAYYEAGYARGLGKQVILTCSESSFKSEEKENRPHFDVAQQSTIVWKDYEDLKRSLKKRIELTI